MNDVLQIEIVTPERRVVNETATEVTIPAKKGYLGVLPGHAPLISELAVGEISYRVPDGATRRLCVAWGFIEVLPEKVTILAETAERADEIDLARAQEARQRAEVILKANKLDEEHKAAEEAHQRAMTRISVVEKSKS